MLAMYHPTDLSSASAVAFRHALRLSLGGSLVIVHVHGTGTPAAGWDDYPHVREMLARWNVAGMTPAVRKIEATGSDVGAVLAGTLQRNRADLIVLACHPRSAVAAWLKPSVSRALVRHTRLPALFVPEGCEGFIDDLGVVDLASILVAVAPEPDPQTGIDAATGILWQLGARADTFVALHAGAQPLQPAPVLPFIAGTQTRVLTVGGRPADVIVATARSESSTLIVMTSAGHDGFMDAVRGSTSEQVIREAPCPVLVVPAPAYDAAPG